MLTFRRVDTVDETTPNSRVYGYTVIIAIGAGCYIQSSFAVAQAKVPRSRSSDAGGYIALAQNLGIVLAPAISGSVFQNVAVDNLQSLLPNFPKDALQGAVSGANSGLFSRLPTTVREQVLSVIVAAMAKTYILVITAGAMTVVGSLFLSVSTKRLTKFIFKVTCLRVVWIAREALSRDRGRRLRLCPVPTETASVTKHWTTFESFHFPSDLRSSESLTVSLPPVVFCSCSPLPQRHPSQASEQQKTVDINCH